MSRHDDDLLRPSVRDEDLPGATARPWDPRSMFFVAFFGGVVAATALAYIDAGRLALPPRSRQTIVAVGGLALIAVAALVAVLAPEQGGLGDANRNLRLAGRVVAVLAHLVFLRVLRPGSRAFELRDGDYASLWRPGLIAVAVGGIAQAVLVAAVLLAVG